MTEKPQFITMNINVDGQIYKVKVEKGVTFNYGAKENSWNSCWAESNEKVGIIKNRNNIKTSEYGDCSYSDGFTSSVEYSSEIKMSKGEFAIFKNFADNNKEKGDEIILSKDDINDAEELYSKGKFTDDMSKSLPNGYKANRDDQILEHQGIYCYVGGSVTNTHTGEKSQVDFILDDDNYNVFSNIKKYAKESANGEVVTEVDGEDMSCWVEGVSFADKEGKKHYIGVEAGSYHEISYKDGNKNVTETYDMDDYTGKTVQYTQGGKTYTENYDENNSFTGKHVSYKNKQGKTVNEHYDKNNKLSSKNDGKVYEYYDNGVLCQKEFGNNVLKYENGKLKSSETKKNGMKIVRNASGVKTSFEGFNITKYTNFERSAEGQKYYEEFKNMNPAEIAKKLKSQIDLPSGNAKTLAMVEGVPTHKLYDVMKAYSQTGGIWFGNKAGLLTDLADEWGMKPDDLTEVAKRAFASYLLVTKDDNLSKADSEMVKMLTDGCSDEEKIKEFLQNVEKQIIK